MKQSLSLFTLTLLILLGLGCGSTEDPIDEPKEVQLKPGNLQVQVESIEGVTIHVRLIKDGQLISQTDAEGNYEFEEVEQGQYTVEISAKGFETTELNVMIEAGETYILDKVTLSPLDQPVSHLNGKLTDEETGNVIVGVLVKLTDESAEEYETLTSDAGVFTFENLPVDQTFTLTISHVGYEDQEVSIDVIGADETREIDVKLTAIPEPEILDPGKGLSVGSQAPEFELPDSNNQLHTLADFIGNKKTVIVFYRGGW
jgi:hypothetical protein